MNEYIMTSIDSDVQFVDNASDDYMSDEERNYWIDVEEGVTDEEIEETSYQMTDEEQKGLEEYLDDEPYEPIDDVLVDDLMNLCFCQPTQAELEEKRIAEEKIQEKAKRLEQVKRAKQLSSENLYSKWHRESVNILANHLNRRVK